MPKIKLNCNICHKDYSKLTSDIKRGSVHNFCSKKCFNIFQDQRLLIRCQFCNKEILKKQYDIKRAKNVFCSRSCNASYGNTHKTSGYNRSKLEIWLSSKLTTLYPKLEFHFNKIDTINAELDIYIPSLKLAFELNGIFHYEPIYGEEKLERTRSNDKRKFQACLEHNIELVIIDSSQQKYFKESTSQKYLDIITKIINLKESSEHDSQSHH